MNIKYFIYLSVDIYYLLKYLKSNILTYLFTYITFKYFVLFTYEYKYFYIIYIYINNYILIYGTIIY